MKTLLLSLTAFVLLYSPAYADMNEKVFTCKEGSISSCKCRKNSNGEVAVFYDEIELYSTLYSNPTQGVKFCRDWIKSNPNLCE